MTSLQTQYWALQEQKRHNAEMERLTGSELGIKGQQAEAALRQAGVSERNVAIAESLEPYEKWLKGSSTAKNIVGAVDEFSQMMNRPVEKAKDRMGNAVGKLADLGLGLLKLIF